MEVRSDAPMRGLMNGYSFLIGHHMIYEPAAVGGNKRAE